MLGRFTLGGVALGASGVVAVEPVVLSATVTFSPMTASGSFSAPLPQPELSASVTFSALSAIGNLSTELPSPVVSGSILFGAPSVSGYFTGGRVTITVNSETNIAEPDLSSNINELELSISIGE